MANDGIVVGVIAGPTWGEQRMQNHDSDSGGSRQQWVACPSMILFVVGFFLAYLSFIVGALFLALGIFYGIELLFYNAQWQEHLSEYADKLETAQGKIVARSSTKDPRTDAMSYSVIIEYCYDASKGQQEDAVSVIHKTFDVLSVAAADLYACSSPEIEIKVSPNLPESGIPPILLHRKLGDLKRRDIYLLKAFALAGIPIYLFLAYVYGRLIGAVVIIVDLAALAAFLMLPYALILCKSNQQQRLELLQVDMCKVVTRMDRFRSMWEKLGPTPGRKFSMALFPVGAFFVMVQGAIFGGFMGLLGLPMLIFSIAAFVVLWRYPLSREERNKLSYQASVSFLIGSVLVGIYFVFGYLLYTDGEKGAGSVSTVFLSAIVLPIPAPQFYVWVERLLREYKSVLVADSEEELHVGAWTEDSLGTTPRSSSTNAHIENLKSKESIELQSISRE